MKFKHILVAILAAFLLIALGVLWYFRTNYVVMDGTVYPRDLQQLDLSGAALAEPEKLTDFSQLQELNLRHTGLTADRYDDLQAKLPGCHILWSVPFQGTTYPEDTVQLSLTELDPADIPTLAYFTRLHTVDATECTDYDALMLLGETYPQLEIAYRVSAGSQQLPQSTTSLILGDGTVDELTAALAYLPQLRTVDASGCTDYEALQALQQQYPACTIRYTVELGGILCSNAATRLTLDNPDAKQLEAMLPWLPNLRSLRLTNVQTPWQDIQALQLAYPQIHFDWDFQLCGVTVNSNDTLIDLSNIPMEGISEVEGALGCFYRLNRVIMCDCGISNEDMDALSKRHPDIRFVWTVSIGHRIRLRTDATYLMPYQYGTKLTDGELENLKYCIDLECIDFGHSDVSDISFLAYTPHMKYLLLGDTEVSDLSPCAGLQELVYAELFMTRVTDYSPLINCKSLQDLNICYALPDDISALCQMTQLKNLWMKGYWLPEGKAQLHEALPETKIVFTTLDDPSATSSGWRQLPNYYAMRDLLGMFYMSY